MPARTLARDRAPAPPVAPQPDDLKVFSTIAHEMRGPLTALATSSEILVEDFESIGTDTLREMVGAIHRRTLWLQGLVENLLCAATIREGRLQIQHQPVNLPEVIAEIQPVVEPLLAQKGQRLRLRRSGTPAEVLADGRRIGQVLVNLILNASKFSPERTIVDISVTRHGHLVRVAVADRGPGFPDGTANRLFDPFFRAEEVRHSGKEGVGLGLSIVRSIIQAHNGRVGAENRRGGGACFWFELSARPVTSVRRPEWPAPDDRR